MLEKQIVHRSPATNSASFAKWLYNDIILSIYVHYDDDASSRVFLSDSEIKNDLTMFRVQREVGIKKMVTSSTF